MRLAFVLGVGCALVACHKPDPATGDDDDTIDGSMGSNHGGSDASVPDGFTMLIQRSWTIPPDSGNIYKCVRIQVPNEMWITAFHSDAPVGSHHSVLTISTTNTQTGEYDCGAGTLDSQMLYAAGINTDDNYFPDGVAIHIPAGTYVNLNLHLYNTTDNSITNTSGVSVKTMNAADVVNEADMMFAGTGIITIPPDGQPHDAVGGCTASSPYHMFTLWPHMHQTAIHQKVTRTPNGTTTAASLLDVPYSFTDQKNYPMTDTMINAGDKIGVTCTYINNTGATIHFGDGSDAEMCFAGIYRYPAAHNIMGCVQGLGI